MSEIPSVARGTVSPLTRTPSLHGRDDRSPAPAIETASNRTGDRVEISSRARDLDPASTVDARQARIEAIRQQIADGSYETDGKLDQAVSRLFSEIDGG